MHQTITTYNKRVVSMLKGLEVKTILNIKEVNIVKDEISIHFVNAKGNDPLSITYIQKI